MKYSFTHHTAPSRAAGFSLLEVLIAMIVLSIGLLSIAGLVANSLSANNASGFRAEAIRTANALADAVRSNPQGAMDGLYDVAYGASPSGSAKAATDLIAWKASLARLPSGDGAVAVNTADESVLVRVHWSEGRSSAALTEYRVRFNF
jgi:type IV pilus assembly protein PilV